MVHCHTGGNRRRGGDGGFVHQGDNRIARRKAPLPVGALNKAHNGYGAGIGNVKLLRFGVPVLSGKEGVILPQGLLWSSCSVPLAQRQGDGISQLVLYAAVGGHVFRNQHLAAVERKAPLGEGDGEFLQGLAVVFLQKEVGLVAVLAARKQRIPHVPAEQHLFAFGILPNLLNLFFIQAAVHHVPLAVLGDDRALEHILKGKAQRHDSGNHRHRDHNADDSHQGTPPV